MSNVGLITDRIDTSKKYTLGLVFEQNLDATETKKFKYIQYEAGTAAVAGVAGEVCYYDGAGATLTNIVTSDLSDSVNVGAGVLQANLADGNFGWIQVRGSATLTIALTAGADGNALTPVGSTDGSLDVSAAFTDHVCAYADDISEKKIICAFPD
ncbi:MAG: hypothetical protein JKY52_00260 [Flavobacteriales bacterium]|nr:hypothetical protein [Flavobacteriales bacterium]